jgi:hypothetical protein
MTCVSVFADCDFYLDNSPVSIYKLWVAGDQDQPQVENLYIREPNGKLTLLTDDSVVISKIPKKVRTVRIFADGPEHTLETVREHVRTMEIQ